MGDVITVPMVGIAALVFAVLMSVHAMLAVYMLTDDYPVEAWQFLIVCFGWFWWAYLLWLSVVE
jgi:hypothetical protein